MFLDFHNPIRGVAHFHVHSISVKPEAKEHSMKKHTASGASLTSYC